MPSLKNCNGFTLVEKLVVIAIIGILASIAIPNLWHDMTVKEEAKMIEGDVAFLVADRISRMGFYSVEFENNRYIVKDCQYIINDTPTDCTTKATVSLRSNAVANFNGLNYIIVTPRGIRYTGTVELTKKDKKCTVNFYSVTGKGVTKC